MNFDVRRSDLFDKHTFFSNIENVVNDNFLILIQNPTKCDNLYHVLATENNLITIGYMNKDKFGGYYVNASQAHKINNFTQLINTFVKYKFDVNTFEDFILDTFYKSGILKDDQMLFFEIEDCYGSCIIYQIKLDDKIYVHITGGFYSI
jgi:hypothetical protein